MGLLPDAQNCGLRMRRECRKRFPRHRLQRKPLVSDPDMHHGTCATHVLWCISGSLTRGGEENVPGIPGAYATRNFMYLVRGPWWGYFRPSSHQNSIAVCQYLVSISNTYTRIRLAYECSCWENCDIQIYSANRDRVGIINVIIIFGTARVFTACHEQWGVKYCCHRQKLKDYHCEFHRNIELYICGFRRRINCKSFAPELNDKYPERMRRWPVSDRLMIISLLYLIFLFSQYGNMRRTN